MIRFKSAPKDTQDTPQGAVPSPGTAFTNSATISPEDLLWFTETMERVEFRLAKSMPSIPHFYTHKHQNWPDKDDYVRAGNLILTHGQPEALWKFPIRRYLYAGPWRYWLMTTDINESFIMNRCDPLHPRYRGAIRPVVEPL